VRHILFIAGILIACLLIFPYLGIKFTSGTASYTRPFAREENVPPTPSVKTSPAGPASKKLSEIEDLLNGKN